MTYFSSDFVKFFEELEENNHKEWFDENRKRYEKEIKNPFKAFITDLILAIQKFDPEIMIKPKDAIFRINRDIRFSKNKQPYKNNVAAFISKVSKKEQFPGYYMHLDAKGIWLGGGLYELSTENIYKVRQEILYNEKNLNDALNEKGFDKEFGELQGEKNKILKAPFKEFGEDIPILFQKQFYFMKQFPASKITSDTLVNFCAGKFEKAYPVNKFLRLAVENLE
ncbi:DUF2461 domain-containing protein [Marivirga sp.]|uniref:DUF2461 domain-containing protein n=1 Tax=Marivirga sp. TaxID=2018662 RepID=UPI002D7F7430|nr:DUF2461 domain-containing protein [Marivirga sp.]HET8858590.1 DUF2461 domain-containing protein [Marivirga sp.]